VQSRHKSWISRPIALIGAACAAALLAACGSSSSSSSQQGASTGSASQSAQSGSLNPLRARLTQYEGVAQFIAPGPSFNARKASGKTVFSIPISSENPFTTAVDQAQARAAKLVGLKYIDFPNQGQVSQWIQGMDQAIARHVNLIILTGAPNPAQLQPQIAAAKRAGIPVIENPSAQPAICTSNPSYQSQRYPGLPNCFKAPPVPASSTQGLTSYTDGPYPEEAALMADWGIVQTQGKLHALVINSPEIYTAASILGVFHSEMQRWCPQSCKMTTINVPLADWATKIQSSVQTALLRDPSINYVLPLFDSENEFVIPGITSAHRAANLHIVSSNGTPSALQTMQKGTTVAADLGESLNWKGFNGIDQALRVLLHLPPAAAGMSPLRLWTKANVSGAGNPPTATSGYGSSYLSGFTKLWQLTK
jgi:ribose transport system substrate-binding protein